MKKDFIGYGNLTNVLKVKKVIMIEHMEGTGAENCPMRTIRTFFDEDMKFIHREDPFTKPN